LAQTSALACGAEICLVPEIPYDIETIGARLKHDLANGRKSAIAVFAEGTKMGDYLTRFINDSISMEARLTVLGHIQRGGSPTLLDRVMAHKFAVAAVDPREAGQTNSIMVFKDGSYSHLPVHEVADSKYRLDPALLKWAGPLAA